MKLGYGVVAGLGQGLNQIANMGWRQFFMKKEEDAARERARQNMEMQAELNRQAAQEAFERKVAYDKIQQPLIAAQRAQERQQQLDDAEADRKFKREMEDLRATNNLKVAQVKGKLGAKSGGQGGGKLSPVDKLDNQLFNKDVSTIQKLALKVNDVMAANPGLVKEDPDQYKAIIDHMVLSGRNSIATERGRQMFDQSFDSYTNQWLKDVDAYGQDIFSGLEDLSQTEPPQKLSNTLTPIDAPQDRYMPDYVGGALRGIGKNIEEPRLPGGNMNPLRRVK